MPIEKIRELVTGSSSDSDVLDHFNSMDGECRAKIIRHVAFDDASEKISYELKVQAIQWGFWFAKFIMIAGTCLVILYTGIIPGSIGNKEIVNETIPAIKMFLFRE